MVRRELGEGRWDKILMRRMVALSNADNYDEAKEEWLATGSVWWRGNGEMPEWVSNSQQGHGNCLCGHTVVYHFEIVNTENGNRECVGSDHINSYLIMRQIAKETGTAIEHITEEMIQKWINVRVGSMKAEAWWAENGESFEMMFNKIKEIDVRYNTRSQHKNYHYDREINEYVYPKQLRKKGEGTFGATHYKMASIVWRWNHPDNPKNQQTTRGYPNDKLMQDLALYFVQSEPLIKKMLEEKSRREFKRLKVIEDEKKKKEQQVIRNRRYKINQLFRGLNSTFKTPNETVHAKERHLYNKHRAEQERILREKRLEERKLADMEMLSSSSEAFEDMCEFYGIPVFDESFAGSDWEREFLTSIKYQLSKQKELTSRQLSTCKDIFETNPATDKQIKYLRSLGYKGKVESKRFASNKIKELKGDE